MEGAVTHRRIKLGGILSLRTDNGKRSLRENRLDPSHKAEHNLGGISNDLTELVITMMSGQIKMTASIAEVENHAHGESVRTAVIIS
ncbi:3173_t:CDS:2 [Acaulospora morrowiae]|uniref:3173_t:CDS:1 n=1 Tax=Acaulospora morrowiae TaxID=94023 RepID=A0A9N9GME6_9GLOM|nr:3173_t:CDS:2 [Acaulospora morrowiae]